MANIDVSERYTENPYLKKLEIKTKGVRVSVSAMGDKDNVIVNQKTGEQTATHVTAFKKVDSGSFVKLFAENIAFTFDLKSSGLKALNVVIWVLQYNGIGKDKVTIDSLTLEDFNDHQGIEDNRFSISTLMKGMLDLQKAQIIAKAARKGVYYINPNFIFNGDRIAFTTVLEREKS